MPGTPLQSLPVRSGMATSSRTHLGLKDIRQIVARSLGYEERETVLNDLSEIAEAYESGWMSGSDSGEDS